METQFIPMDEKAKMYVKLRLGEEKTIKEVFDEIQRLEGVIKDYEIGIKNLNNKFESKIFKHPQNKA